MPTSKHDDEIIYGITYGRAVAAVASRVLLLHGLPDNSQIFQEPDAFQKLIEQCPYLPESLESGVPLNTPDNPDETIIVIVEFVNADLYYDQLDLMAHTIRTITAANQTRFESLADILDQIRAGADSIDDADTQTQREAVNRQAKARIASAVAELQPLATLLKTIKQQGIRIDAPRGSQRPEVTNQEAQSIILSSLEQLAFALHQDEWAVSHGFRKPDTPQA